MLMKRLIFLGLGFSLLLVMLLAPAAAHAAEAEVTVIMPELFYLDMTYSELSFTGDSAPTIDDFFRDASELNWSEDTDPDFDPEDYGYTDEYLDPEIIVWANAGWALYVIGSTSSFTGPYSKPAEDIIWMDGENNGWHRLTTSGDPVLVHDMVTKPVEGHHHISMDFRILLQWAYDQPGDYTYEFVELTLTAD